MDCMDCHNRPRHQLPPPEAPADQATTGGRLDRDLPWIKKVLVDNLVKDYKTRAEAHAGITQAVQAFYAKEYPQVSKDRKQAIDVAVQTALDIYDHSVFPDMNVNWTTYTMNIGH